MNQTRQLDVANRVLQKAGGPLPLDVRLPFEQRFGCSLRHIRIHAGEEAARVAAALEARAFAFGDHIVLSRWEQDLSNPATLEVLAHEVAHCLQQRGQTGSSASGIGSASDPVESEAHEAAACVLQGQRVNRLSPDLSGLIRRVVSVVPGTAAINITQQPAVNLPFQANVPGIGDVMRFTSDQLRFTGSVDLTGDAADPSNGWTLGVIQLQWVETNWGYYRGQVNNHGSTFLQRARPPARLQQACRDTIAVGAILVDNNAGLPGPPVAAGVLHDRYVTIAGEPFPIHMALIFIDGPTEAYPTTWMNPITHQQNFLREVQLEFHFCSILTLLSPAGNFQHLKHIYWNVHWQTSFAPVNPAMPGGPLNPVPVARGTSATVSPVYDGRPIDRRFANIITLPGAANCNQVANHELNNPNVRASAVWHNFDVTK